MNIVNLPFKTDGESVKYGSFERLLIRWDGVDVDELENMILESGLERGSVRFEDDEPVSVSKF